MIYSRRKYSSNDLVHFCPICEVHNADNAITFKLSSLWCQTPWSLCNNFISVSRWHNY